MAPKSATRRAFGQLRQLPSGRWQAAYTGPDGNRHKAPRTYAVEDDAIGWLNIERRKIDLGTWGAFERSDGITLGPTRAAGLTNGTCGPAPSCTTSRC